jgi:hypothetical protein
MKYIAYSPYDHKGIEVSKEYAEQLEAAGWHTVPSKQIEALKAPRQKPIADESGAVKTDDNKHRFDLIPAEALFALTDIITFGARKYADRNWEKGMSWGRMFGALMRHMWAWWGGEDLDPESGKSHLWHALCCLVFLVAYEQRKIGKDDRSL